jgi:hypothetical protein
LGDINRKDSAFCSTEEHSFEAVAVDCSYASDSAVTVSSNDCQRDELNSTPASDGSAGRSVVKKSASDVPKNASDVPKNPSAVPKSDINNSPESENKFALLILAGLTGGSGEGYVLDLVHSANMIGVLIFLLFVCLFVLFVLFCFVLFCLVWFGLVLFCLFVSLFVCFTVCLFVCLFVC